MATCLISSSSTCRLLMNYRAGFTLKHAVCARSGPPGGPRREQRVRYGTDHPHCSAFSCPACFQPCVCLVHLC